MRPILSVIRPASTSLTTVWRGVSIKSPEPPAYVVRFQVDGSSDEAPAAELGAGGPNHCPDAVVGPDHTVALRAERSGAADGRVYTIVVSATDDCGNTGFCEVQVTVPMSQGPNGAAVDSGQVFDATVCGG